MPVLYRIIFGANGESRTFAGCRGNYYEFADGRRLDLHSRPAWCTTCGKVVHAERLATLEQIDARLAELHQYAASSRETKVRGVPYALTMEGQRYFDDLEQKAAEARRRREWRRGRIAPAKCLNCGSTDVLLLTTNPTGPGDIRLEVVGMCSTVFNEWFFTPEGDRIPRDTKPTYWFHPGLPNNRNTEVDREMVSRFVKSADPRPARQPPKTPPATFLRRVGRWFARGHRG